MASLSLTKTELIENLAMLMGEDRDAGNHDLQTTSDINRIIRAGKRMFLAAHSWSFLEQNISLVTGAPFETGTVTATEGVVTLAGGTWPSNVAEQKFVPLDSDSLAVGVYDIASRDSDTQITLSDTSLDLAALTTYQVYFTRISMPSNFGGFLDPITIENSNEVQELAEYPVFPEWTVRLFGDRKRLKTGRPEMFSVNMDVDEDTGSPSYFLNVYPLPDAAYVLKARMRVQPGDGLDDEDFFHPVFAELLQLAILSTAEAMYNDAARVHSQKFAGLLPAFVDKDNRMRGVRRILPRKTQVVDGSVLVARAPTTWETI